MVIIMQDVFIFIGGGVILDTSNISMSTEFK